MKTLALTVATLLTLEATAQGPVPQRRPLPPALPPGQYGDRQSGYWGDPGDGYFGNPGRGEFRRYNFPRNAEGTVPRLPAKPVKPGEEVKKDEAPYMVLEEPAD